MTLTDRLGGARSSLGYKAPCRVATTTNITLAGEQTIDGVAIALDDRVLVKDQTNTAENGIYEVRSKSWVRAADWGQSRDFTQGTRVGVVQGSTGAGVYQLVTSGVIVLGTTGLSFAIADATAGDYPYPAGSRTILKALDTTLYQTAYLAESGREGVFLFRSGDYSTEVAADTQEGVYIAANDTASTSGAWVRADDAALNVGMYGATGDGATDDSAAFDAMEAAVGFVRVPYGNFAIGTNTTLDVPLFFEAGGYVTIGSGVTLTLTSRVEAPRQWIFRGDGDVSLTTDANSGEDSREVHVSWFGAFPTPQDAGANQTPYIQAAIDAMGNLREGVVYFDIGAYEVSTAITVNRGIHIKGDATRRTVFYVTADSFDVFTTAGVAARFSGIQFEVDTTGIGSVRTSGAFIKIDHTECDLYDVAIADADEGIEVNANNCRVENIFCTYGNAMSAGSYGIKIAATGCSVDGVLAGTSATGPDALVLIGGTSTISNTRVENVNYVVPSRGVHIDATAGSVVRTEISGIRYNGSAGTAPDYAIYLETGSTFTLSDVHISESIVNAYATGGIRLQQASSGAMSSIIVDTFVKTGGTNGIDLNRSAGTLSNVVLDGTVDVRGTTNGVTVTGTTSGVYIDPIIEENRNVPFTKVFPSIADDTAVSIALLADMFTGVVIVTAGTGEYGMCAARAASTPSVVAMVASANFETSTSALSGTTGSDTKVTLGVTDGALYVENRTGSQQNISVTVLNGYS